MTLPPPDILALFMVCAFVGFITSTIFGIGGALVLMPALMLKMPAAEAIALSAPVLLFNNIFKGLVFRRYIDWKAALSTLATAMPFAVVGAMLSSSVDGDILKLAVAALIVLALVSEHLLRLTFSLHLRGLAMAGAGIGFISGICGAAGPPTVVAYRAHGLLKEHIVGTIAVLAIGMQLAKIPTYFATGTLRIDHAPLAGCLVLSSFAAVLIGRKLLGHIKPRPYRRALDVVLFILALWLVAGVAKGG